MATSSLPIGVDELEERLAAIRAAATRPEAGAFGPESLLWRIDREAALFLGAGRALLLQLAHPWVAAAIAEHSRALADPIARFHRTFDIMFTLVFGTLDQAFSASRRLHRRHAAVSGCLAETVGPFAAGSAYRANEAEALQWVHATLVETALLAHDLALPPLTEEERERYYGESRLLGAMFGLAPERQPADWRAFAAYGTALLGSDVLTVGPPARRIAEHIIAGAGTALSWPAWYRDLTASLLPDRLREGFGLAYGEGERRRAWRARTWLRRAYALAPERLRFVGPYQEAVQRLAGQPRPDLATRGLNRLWIGRPSMERAPERPSRTARRP